MKNKKGAIPAIVLAVMFMLVVGYFYKSKDFKINTIVKDATKEACPEKSFLNTSLGPNTVPFLSNQYVEVINPLEGHIYHVGDTINIEWKNCNLPDSFNSVAIFLHDNRYPSGLNGEVYISNVKTVKGINSYKFLVPSSINQYFSNGTLNGRNNYQIFISDGVVGATGHSDKSETFSILP
jgi:hypothetical protein